MAVRIGNGLRYAPSCRGSVPSQGVFTLTIAGFRHLLRYNDWANDAVLAAAAPLADAALDRPIDMGVGGLRRTLVHIFNGEHVWLNRWQGIAETPWPDESERVAIPALRQRFERLVQDRDGYLETLSDAALAEDVAYRDSKGSRFRAARRDMLIQAFVHSTHHRAQAANMLRQVGAGLVELDYMMSLRKPE